MIIGDMIATTTANVGTSFIVGITTGIMTGMTGVQLGGTKAAKKVGAIEIFHRVQRKDTIAVATGTAIMTVNGRAVIATIRIATVIAV